MAYIRWSTILESGNKSNIYALRTKNGAEIYHTNGCVIKLSLEELKSLFNGLKQEEQEILCKENTKQPLKTD